MTRTAQQPTTKIREQDITGLKYFDKLGPLLDRLHGIGCQRDAAGNRTLHFGDEEKVSGKAPGKIG